MQAAQSVKYVNVISIEFHLDGTTNYYLCAAHSRSLQIKLNVIYVNDLVENNLIEEI